MIEPGIPADRLVVLYDADCGICAATVRSLGRRDRGRQLEFVPLATAATDARSAIRHVATTHPLHAELHVVDPASGAVRAGGPAVLAVVARLPGGGPFAAVGRLRPFAWGIGVAYAFVARNRRAIGRALRFEQTCSVPPR